LVCFLVVFFTIAKQENFIDEQFFSLMSKNLTFSIITVSYNAEKHIEQCIQSVLAQTYPYVEHWVIDGASTDNTVNIIRRYTPQLAGWLSEPDKGIADAMNKGLAQISGDYVLFLHADDYLYSHDSLGQLIPYMQSSESLYVCDVLFGNPEVKLRRQVSGWHLGMNFKNKICHQGFLCDRKVFKHEGCFDTQFKISMDYDVLLRLYRRGYKLHYIPHVLSVMRDNGISSRRDWTTLKKRFREEQLIQQKNTPHWSMKWIYSGYWFLYWPYRYIKSIIK